MTWHSPVLRSCGLPIAGCLDLHFSLWSRSALNLRNHLLVFVASLLVFTATELLPAAEPTPAQLFQSGKYVECVDALAQAIATTPFQESFRVLKLKAELELGRYPESLVTLEEALKKFPNSIELRWLGRDVCRFNNQSQRVSLFLDEIGQLVNQTPWRYSDAANRIVVGKFLLHLGVDAKQVLTMAYNGVKKQQPDYVPAWLASGDLALEKSDFALAAQAYSQAVKLDSKEPNGHLGLARSFAASEPKKSNESVQAALGSNPNHVPSLLFLVDELVDSEKYVEAEDVLQQIAKVNPHHPLAAAYRAVLAHLRNQPERESGFRQVGLKYWSTNPEVDHLIGKKLSQKYRFAEGSEYQRRALSIDPKYVPARIQLAQDLLRLGKEEGWGLAAEVHAADGYNIVAHNLINLQTSVSQFRTLESDGIIVRMDSQEAEIYGQRVLSLLRRAKDTLCEKYEVKIGQPVIVELFPRQEDFAIRTFGLPGGAGFLGVCFGTLITANSPASQGTHPACWESTLWHEFCHVVTLQKTRNRMPRWLSEGISVYEERQAHPAWGQEINPVFRKMLLGDELVPVDQLSSAFLRPASGQHLQFAYFESSLVVEYLIEKHGLATLKSILEDLGQGLMINDSLDRRTGSLQELNAGFTDFARQKANLMAPTVDWSEPEISKRADVAQIEEWLKKHPRSYIALQRLATVLVSQKKWDAAKAPLQQMQKLYPQDAASDGVYPLLARVHRELNELAAERSVLEQFATLTDDNLELFSRLAELAIEAQEWKLAKEYAERWMSVNPLQPAAHRIAAQAAEQLNDESLATQSLEALLSLNSVNGAEIHHRLATVHLRSGRLTESKRHALLAVEEAPRFRAGHRLLLEVIQRIEDSSRSRAGAASATPISQSLDRPGPPPLPTMESR